MLRNVKLTKTRPNIVSILLIIFERIEIKISAFRRFVELELAVLAHSSKFKIDPKLFLLLLIQVFYLNNNSIAMKSYHEGISISISISISHWIEYMLLFCVSQETCLKSTLHYGSNWKNTFKILIYFHLYHYPLMNMNFVHSKYPQECSFSYSSQLWTFY